MAAAASKKESDEIFKVLRAQKGNKVRPLSSRFPCESLS
jgi:hypothetical protein